LALGISALRIGLRIGLRSEDSSEERETRGAPQRSEFSFHFVVPFEQMSCDDLLANPKDAMAHPGRSKANYRCAN
jgi:hypothetical protein